MNEKTIEAVVKSVIQEVNEAKANALGRNREQGQGKNRQNNLPEAGYPQVGNP